MVRRKFINTMRKIKNTKGNTSTKKVKNPKLTKKEVLDIVNFNFYKFFIKNLKSDLSNLPDAYKLLRIKKKLTKKQREKFRKDLIASGVDAKVLMSIGASKAFLIENFTIPELKEAGMPLIDIIKGLDGKKRFSEIEKYYDKDIIKKVKDSIEILGKVGAGDLSGLRRSNYNPLVLKTFGIKTLKQAGYGPKLFKKLGYSVYLLKELGYTEKELLYLGYKKSELSKLFS